MASIKIQTGQQVAVKSTGKTGTVSGLIPIKTGKQGRPRTSVIVQHDADAETPSHTAEYGVSDLKVLA